MGGEEEEGQIGVGGRAGVGGGHSASARRGVWSLKPPDV